jgi:DNA-binding MarR family transcriptional regulator
MRAVSAQANIPANHQALTDEWTQLSRRYTAISAALGRELDERHGLSLHEFEVLARLAVDDHDQHRMQELADATNLTQSALSRLVSRLEQEGLVKRSMCDVDRRGIYACLADAGRQRYEEALPTYRAVLAGSLASGAVLAAGVSP